MPDPRFFSANEERDVSTGFTNRQKRPSPHASHHVLKTVHNIVK